MVRPHFRQMVSSVQKLRWWTHTSCSAVGMGGFLAVAAWYAQTKNMSKIRTDPRSKRYICNVIVSD